MVLFELLEKLWQGLCMQYTFEPHEGAQVFYSQRPSLTFGLNEGAHITAAFVV